jgi:hypothetical protein
MNRPISQPLWEEICVSTTLRYRATDSTRRTHATRFKFSFVRMLWKCGRRTVRWRMRFLGYGYGTAVRSAFSTVRGGGCWRAKTRRPSATERHHPAHSRSGQIWGIVSAQVQRERSTRIRGRYGRINSEVLSPPAPGCAFVEFVSASSPSAKGGIGWNGLARCQRWRFVRLDPGGCLLYL